MKKAAVLFLLGSALFWSCSKSSSGPDYTPDCSGPAKSYSADVSPIIQSYCTGCHSKYGNYSQVAAEKSAIRSSIVNGSMPTQGALSVAQKNTVVCWIDNGAPNN